MRAWLLALAVASSQALAQDSDGWQASASEQVGARLVRDAGQLCLDYDFHGVSGYAVMRRDYPMDWPEDFALTMRVSGQGRANDVQLKLVDASGDNVWWARRDSYLPKADGEPWRIKRRHISFAWGPQADHELRRTFALEVVVAAANQAGSGGAGRLCMADLHVEPLKAERGPPPEPRITQGHGRLDVDLGRSRDFMGLLIEGLQARGPVRVETSIDGKRWKRLATQSVNGRLDALWLPESEARYLRLLGARTLKHLELPSPTEWVDRNSMLKAIAAKIAPGSLPRAFLGQQNYWTLVGADGGRPSPALISEDGALEPWRGGPNVEPQLRLADGEWLNWTNAQLTQSLRERSLPMPEVAWQWPQGVTLALETAALPDGRLLARYRVANRGSQALTLEFGLAVRPWQVNPPQQFLNTPGGVAAIHQIERREGTLWVDGRPMVVPAQPAQWRAAPFAAGLTLDTLRQAPRLAQPLRDPQGLASAWTGHTLTLASGESHEFAYMLPLDAKRLDVAPLTAFDELARTWRERLGGVRLIVPPAQQRVADTLHTALAHILISRDGPALRPGTRSYARSWIRDGAMMVEGLARMGHLDVAKEFVDWFAPHQYASGKVPCCVDARGADPVAENDSEGELIFAIAEVWRYGGDRAWLEQQWPHVRSALLYMEAQRQSERTAHNQEPERRQLFGLLPPSISHEGYSDKPAYAYWDDFWGLRGYKDAVQIAQSLGHAEEAQQWAAWRDEFATELNASLRATAERFKLNVLAGAADRGDVDPTSSTMAMDPAQADVPRDLLVNTLERYWQESERRRQGLNKGDDYTPYELRNISALARLGWPERAQAMLDFFFADQRPQGWNQWAEVVMRKGVREPRFLGDMPHAWVASDYIRAALDLFAYEREPGLYVLAGGLPRALLDEGVGIEGLYTPQGRLSWHIGASGKAWRLRLDRPPALALRFAWSGEDILPRATAQGRVLQWQGRELLLPPGIDEVLLEPQSKP